MRIIAEIRVVEESYHPLTSVEVVLSKLPTKPISIDLARAIMNVLAEELVFSTQELGQPENEGSNDND